MESENVRKITESFHRNQKSFIGYMKLVIEYINSSSLQKNMIHACSRLHDKDMHAY